MFLFFKNIRKYVLGLLFIVFVMSVSCGIAYYNYYSINPKKYGNGFDLGCFGVAFWFHGSSDDLKSEKGLNREFDLKVGLYFNEDLCEDNPGINLTYLRLDSLILQDTIRPIYQKVESGKAYLCMNQYKPFVMSNNLDSLSFRIYISYPVGGEKVHKDTTVTLYHHEGNEFYVD